MQFLQMRFDYGVFQHDIVQSAVVNIVFDDDIDCICPECSLKLCTVVPALRVKSEVHHSRIAELIIDMPDNVTLHFDEPELFEYLSRENTSILGMQYFDESGMVQYDNGIYHKPDCLDKLQIELYTNIVKNIEIRKGQYSYILEHGEKMSKDKKEELIVMVNATSNTKPLDTYNKN